MNRPAHHSFPVVLMGVAAAVMVLPAAHAAVNRQFDVGRAFLYSAVILGILALLIGFATANLVKRVSPRRQLTYLIGTYFALPLAFALPIVQAVPGVTLWQAWFEMLSAFTTTGATLFAPADLPETVHLWRALAGWLGGFHVIVMALAVLAPMNLVGIDSAGTEASTSSVAASGLISQIADAGQRIQYFSIMLFPAYGGLTLLLWVGLLVAGEDGLVALCHAMAVLSTSGISPIAGTEQAASGILGEVMIAIFLLTAISRRALPGFAGLERRFWRYDPELLTAGVIILVAVFAVMAMHLGAADQWMRIDQFAKMVWGAFFTALSFLTTTGFVSVGWQVGGMWSGVTPPGLMLLALSLVGGGVATTAGGVKLLRVYVVCRHGQRELERLIEPSSVGGGGMTARQLRDAGASVAFVFFMLFAMVIAVVTALLTLLSVELEPAMALAIGALTNNGPVAQILGDGPGVWADLAVAQQTVLALAMVMGRLEMLALLAFLTPDLWRR